MANFIFFKDKFKGGQNRKIFPFLEWLSDTSSIGPGDFSTAPQK